MKTKHTKGPFDYFVGNANGRGLIRIETAHNAPEAGVHIASLPRGKKNEAMAAFMVNAMNAHAELVAALEGCVAYWDGIEAHPTAGGLSSNEHALRAAGGGALEKAGRGAEGGGE